MMAIRWVNYPESPYGFIISNWSQSISSIIIEQKLSACDGG